MNIWFRYTYRASAAILKGFGFRTRIWAGQRLIPLSHHFLISFGPYASAPSTVPMLEPGTVRERVDAWCNSSVPPVESHLPPISLPAELPVPPHAPEDSRSDRAPPPRLEAPAAVSDDSASAPSVKRQRQPPASATCAHSQSLAPPFDPDACGHHLGDKSRKMSYWGKAGRKLLPNSYWNDRCLEMTTVDIVLEFFRLRQDRNGEPMSNKLGMPE